MLRLLAHSEPAVPRRALTVHVLQVNTERENLDELSDAITAGCTDSWQMPKGAKTGDVVAVWYASDKDAGPLHGHTQEPRRRGPAPRRAA
jgi:hypothetical protein